MKENKSELITQSTVMEMGFTKAMIKNLLPEPITRPNPIYNCAAPMKLWEKDAVLQIMETDEFKIALEKAEKRRKAARTAVLTKEKRLKEKMIEKANNFELEVIDDEKLIELVLNEKKIAIHDRMFDEMEYLKRKMWRGDLEGRYEDLEEEYERVCCEYEHFKFEKPSNEETINRWVVNFIRHNLINYDDALYHNNGKIGKKDAYPVFKKAVLERIAKEYPKYAEECNRQISWIGREGYYSY